MDCTASVAFVARRTQTFIGLTLHPPILHSCLEDRSILAKRFRGYLPVVVDIETAGLDPRKNPILEIAAVITHMEKDGTLVPTKTHASLVTPFSGATLDPSSLLFNGIDPYHPFRMAVDEKEAILKIFEPIRAAIKTARCTRAILVGHNPAFDIAFLNAAVKRTGIKRNPFHPFSTFDTATLSGLVYGQTVLARAVKAAGMEWIIIERTLQPTTRNEPQSCSAALSIVGAN